MIDVLQTPSCSPTTTTTTLSFIISPTAPCMCGGKREGGERGSGEGDVDETLQR